VRGGSEIAVVNFSVGDVDCLPIKTGKIVAARALGIETKEGSCNVLIKLVEI